MTEDEIRQIRRAVEEGSKEGYGKARREYDIERQVENDRQKRRAFYANWRIEQMEIAKLKKYEEQSVYKESFYVEYSKEVEGLINAGKIAEASRCAEFAIARLKEKKGSVYSAYKTSAVDMYLLGSTYTGEVEDYRQRWVVEKDEWERECARLQEAVNKEIAKCYTLLVRCYAAQRNVAGVLEMLEQGHLSREQSSGKIFDFMRDDINRFFARQEQIRLEQERIRLKKYKVRSIFSFFSWVFAVLPLLFFTFMEGGIFSAVTTGAEIGVGVVIATVLGGFVYLLPFLAMKFDWFGLQEYLGRRINFLILIILGNLLLIYLFTHSPDYSFTDVLLLYIAGLCSLVSYIIAWILDSYAANTTIGHYVTRAVPLVFAVLPLLFFVLPDDIFPAVTAGEGAEADSSDTTFGFLFGLLFMLPFLMMKINLFWIREHLWLKITFLVLIIYNFGKILFSPDAFVEYISLYISSNKLLLINSFAGDFTSILVSSLVVLCTLVSYIIAWVQGELDF